MCCTPITYLYTAIIKLLLNMMSNLRFEFRVDFISGRKYSYRKKIFYEIIEEFYCTFLLLFNVRIWFDCKIKHFLF